jgi:hypothetical protein
MVRFCTPLAAVASELRSVVSEASLSLLASFTRVPCDTANLSRRRASTGGLPLHPKAAASAVEVAVCRPQPTYIQTRFGWPADGLDE